jgi:hypothetical protein
VYGSCSGALGSDGQLEGANTHRSPLAWRWYALQGVQLLQGCMLIERSWLSTCSANDRTHQVRATPGSPHMCKQQLHMANSRK